MLPVPNIDYNQQLAQLQSQIANMKAPAYQAPAIPQIPTQIKYVDGINGAKELQSKMLPNSSEIVMDKNEDLFYVLSKDANGDIPKVMQMGRFTLEQEESNEPAYVTKKDFEAFEQKIIELLGDRK